MANNDNEKWIDAIRDLKKRFREEIEEARARNDSQEIVDGEWFLNILEDGTKHLMPKSLDKQKLRDIVHKELMIQYPDCVVGMGLDDDEVLITSRDGIALATIKIYVED